MYDVTKDDLPDIDNIRSIVYCPGSIILKPFLIIEDDYKNDFEINVLMLVRLHKNTSMKLKLMKCIGEKVMEYSGSYAKIFMER